MGISNIPQISKETSELKYMADQVGRHLETIPYIQELRDTVFSAAHIAYSQTDTLCFKSKLSKYKNNPKYLKYIFFKNFTVS